MSDNQTFGRSNGFNTGTQTWQLDQASSVDIVADRHDTHDQDVADGISSTLKKDGGNTATGHLPMGGFKHTNVAAATGRTDYARFSDLQDGKGIYAPTVGGTATAITITTGYTLTAYAAGQVFRFIAASTNGGATTLNVDGLGVKNVYGPGLTALSAGQILAGAVISVVYDGTQFQIDSSTPTAIAVGTIMAWATASIPTGWLECDGSAVSRTTYAGLFAAIGVTYGPGNGTTTFNLPDYRGHFLRGQDGGAGADPDAASRTDRGDGTTGDAVGTKQASSLAAHTHAAGTFAAASGGVHTHTVPTITSNSAGSGGVLRGQLGTAQGDTWTANSDGAHTHTISGTSASTGDTETRAKNVGVKWIILVLSAGTVSLTGTINVSATDRLLGRVSSGSGPVEEIVFSDFAQSIIDDADAAAVRSTLGLVIGTDIQAYHANLAQLAGLSLVADRLAYANGTGTLALTTFTAAGRALIDDADATAQRSTLGLGTAP